jgi:hypothetical protein
MAHSRSREFPAPLLGIDFVVTLKRAHFWVEGVGAVQLDHLANVSQVMECELVEQLVETEEAELFVASGASSD